MRPGLLRLDIGAATLQVALGTLLHRISFLHRRRRRLRRSAAAGDEDTRFVALGGHVEGWVGGEEVGGAEV